MATPTAPPQNMTALQKANRIRAERAALKYEVAAGKNHLEGVARLLPLIESPPQCILSAPLLDVLRWPRQAGLRVAEGWVADAEIKRHGEVRMRDLTDRERTALAGVLRAVLAPRERPLTDLQLDVLDVVRMEFMPSSYDVAERLGMRPSAAAGVLGRLRARRLVWKDGTVWRLNGA